LTLCIDVRDNHDKHDPEYVQSVAEAWSLVNLGVRRWAELHPDRLRYIVVRLEDFCKAETQVDAIGNFFMALQRPISADMARVLANTHVNPNRCRLQKFAV
jgi:hypothetical protein